MQIEPSTNAKKLKWYKLLPVTGIFIFAALIWKVDINKILGALWAADLGYLYFLPFLVIAGIFLQTLKWYSLLMIQGFDSSFQRIFEITWAGNFFAAVTPGKLGNLVKIGYLKRYTGRSLAECSTGIFTEKVIDTLIILLFALAGSLMSIRSAPALFFYLLASILALAVLIFYFYDRKRTGGKLVALASAFPFLKDRLPDIERATASFFSDLPKKREMLLPFAIGICSWTFIYTQFYLVGLCVGIHLDYRYFLFLLPLGTVSAALPISVNGIGTREAVLVMLFSLYGIPAEKVVVMSLGSVLLCVYIPAVIGFLVSLGLARPAETDH
ncbi:MAG: flippase-like domain-containing protein [Candidatus Omnitrophica bacterium]|nr:flippase-like domain-containing protein [Candidatus Omnitrophota bacterium]